MKNGQPTIEMVAIAALHAAEWNPRSMPEEQMEALRKSLERWGFVDPVIARREDGLVVGGHQRLEAAKAMGIESVPVVFLDDLPLEEAMGLNVALNRIHGEWDMPKLAAVFDELKVADFDLKLTGFEIPEIDNVFATRNAEKEEQFDAGAAMVEAEEAKGPTRVQPGELWQLGRHRLMCGDSMDSGNWERVMEGELAQAVVTDPPYAVNYVGGRGVKRVPRTDAFFDDMTAEQYGALLGKSLTLAHHFTDDKAPLYLWFSHMRLREVFASLTQAEWQERNVLVWVKNSGAGALFAQYRHWYEPCIYAFKKGRAPRWHGTTNERTVWEHDRPLRNDLHPTMKPLALIERSIVNATEMGHLVVDAFLGSGTAIIAAERTGRRCYGLELEARYCDVILARWEAFTGEKAVKVN